MAFPRLRRGFDSLHPLHFIIKHLRHQFPQSFPKSPFSTCLAIFAACGRLTSHSGSQPEKTTGSPLGLQRTCWPKIAKKQTTADTICFGDADCRFQTQPRGTLFRSPCVNRRPIPLSLPPNARRILAGTITSFPAGPTRLLVCENALATAFSWGQSVSVMRLPNP